MSKINNRIWRDEWFVGLSESAKILFLYVITNERVNLCGTYELTDREISFDTGLSSQKLEKTKQEIAPKVLFFKGWVKVVNILKYDPIKGGEKNPIFNSYAVQLSKVPEEIANYFDSTQVVSLPERVASESATSRDGVEPDSYGNGKGKGNGEIVTKEGDDLDESFYEEFAKEENISPKDVRKKCLAFEDYCASKGKRYKSKRATVRGWIRNDIRDGKIKRLIILSSSPVDASFQPVDPGKARTLIQQARSML